MSKYYMLECYASRSGFMDVPDIDEVYIENLHSWRIGKPFNKGTVPEPLEVDIDYPGNAHELLEFYYDDAIVMSKRLHEALVEVGVDNMDIYEIILRQEETEIERHDYIAVNLIGIISAVDIGSSNVTGGSSDHLLDTDFDGVAIDEEKADGELMFRLLENTSAIMVHEKVKNHLLAKGFDMLSFVEPKDWIG